MHVFDDGVISSPQPVFQWARSQDLPDVIFSTLLVFGVWFPSFAEGDGFAAAFVQELLNES